MTIGPDPMTMIVLKSSRRGTVKSLFPSRSAQPGAAGGLPHQRIELAEEIAGIVWSGRRLGVVLHRERRRGARPDPLDDAVVEVDMGHLGVGHRAGGHGVV